MSNLRPNIFIALGVVGLILPLLFIGVAIAYSPWFNIANNALSDLGHAVRSNIASIFNFGLCLGGFIVGAHAVYYILPTDRLFGSLLTLSGFNLVLIAVFDEVYGMLHFIVSVTFFIMLAAFLIVYSIRFKSIAAMVAVVASLVMWVLHFSYSIPKGAAIPELISIAVFIPFYVRLLAMLRKKLDKERINPGGCGGPAGI